MKNTKKIEQINAKITALQKIQKQLEADYVADVSQQIAKILVKKKAYNINKTDLLKRIESLVDEITKGKL